MNVFVISDLHLNHANIIRYANRPFSSIEEMNSTIIDNWNSKVAVDDIVIFVGDFAMGPWHLHEKFLNSLKGIKVLIAGNHDRKSILNLSGWKAVVKDFDFEYGDFTFYFRHEPFTKTDDDIRKIYIHGHRHGYDGFFFNNQYDVSVENINYTPIRLEEIIEHWRKEKGIYEVL